MYKCVLQRPMPGLEAVDRDTDNRGRAEPDTSRPRQDIHNVRHVALSHSTPSSSHLFLLLILLPHLLLCVLMELTGWAIPSL